MKNTLSSAFFKKEYPALTTKINGKRLIYLDNACSLLKSRTAVEASRKLLLSNGSCAGNRSNHLLSVKTQESFNLNRLKIAEFLNAPSPENIIFTRGVTDAVNLITQSLKLDDRRNEIIFSGIEHNSSFLPFIKSSRLKKVKITTLALKGFDVDVSLLSKSISERTALVVLTRASNIFGGVFPVEEICDVARKKGALVFVDCAQYISSHKEDVRKLGVDMLAFSGHKIGSEYATGALYLSDRALDRLESFRVGGGTVKSVTLKNDRWDVEFSKGYAGFEAGTQDYSGCESLTSAIGVLEKMGYPNIRKTISKLMDYAIGKLENVNGLKIVGNLSGLNEGGVISLVPSQRNFSIPDFNIYLNHELEDRFIALRCGKHCAHMALSHMNIMETLRLSFFAYNTEKDVDSFIAAWNDYLKRTEEK
jgi:cysteine desulfurase / selenocysteine lyase